MPALQKGNRFERYRILRPLGSGVSGESYEAEDVLLRRVVTLKLLQPGMVLPEPARRQFFRKMQDISTLTHPYLATVLDYGEVEGQLFIARRFVEAGSLLGSTGRERYHPPLAVANAITYAHQLAQALQHIHNHNYTHGSLTFSNILVLDQSGASNGAQDAPFLLADVGTAYFIYRFGKPHTTHVALTAAPEQKRGHALQASDQYALATILYFWLAGRTPFIGSPEEIETLKRTETIPSLDSLNPEVTYEQEDILRRALKAYPEARYPTILEFTEALLAALTYITPAMPTIPTDTEAVVAHTLTHLVIANEAEESQKREEPQGPELPEGAPLPQVIPDVPQPIQEPDPVPQEPLPTPQPVPEPASPEPEPVEPEILPQPAPDIITPLPDPLTSPLPQEPLPAPSEEPKHSGSLERTEDLAPTSYVTMAYFIINSPYNKEPGKVPVKHEETTLGRAGSSDILLDYDPFTSRHHALIKHEDESYVLFDLNSAYGITINGHLLARDTGHTLMDGDVLRIGVYELIFHLETVPQNTHVFGEHMIS